MKYLTSRRSLLLTFASIVSFNMLVNAAEPARPAKAPVKQDREKIRAERKAREAEVFRADKELNAALVRGDVAALERLVASGFADTYEQQVLDLQEQHLRSARGETMIGGLTTLTQEFG